MKVIHRQKPIDKVIKPITTFPASADTVLRLQKAAWVLTIMAVCLAVYIGLRVYRLQQEPLASFLLEDDNQAHAGQYVTLKKDMLDFENYRKVLERREFFQLAVTPPSQQNGNPTQVAAPSVFPTVAIDLVKYYRLVGVVMDQKPQAIVEDLRNRTTHFLFKGDMLPREDAQKTIPQLPWGDMVVAEILPTRVTFAIDGQSVALDL
jgi:hypothetical protein